MSVIQWHEYLTELTTLKVWIRIPDYAIPSQNTVSVFLLLFCCRQKTKKNLHQIYIGYIQISFQIKKGTLHSPLENQVIHISHNFN